MKATSSRRNAGSRTFEPGLKIFAEPTVRAGRTGVTKVVVPTRNRPGISGRKSINIIGGDRGESANSFVSVTCCICNRIEFPRHLDSTSGRTDEMQLSTIWIRGYETLSRSPASSKNRKSAWTTNNVDIFIIRGCTAVS